MTTAAKAATRSRSNEDPWRLTRGASSTPARPAMVVPSAHAAAETVEGSTPTRRDTVGESTLARIISPRAVYWISRYMPAAIAAPEPRTRSWLVLRAIPTMWYTDGCRPVSPTTFKVVPVAPKVSWVTAGKATYSPIVDTNRT